MNIGIDIGITGGICFLDDDNTILQKMPLRIVQHKGRKELDGDWLCNEINRICAVDTLVTVESAGYHYKMSATMRSCALSYGIIVGVVASLGLPILRVEPKKWQRELLGKVPRGRTKEHALALAFKLWPDEDWRANKRCKIPHDGMVDSALLAYYGLQSKL